MFSVLCEANLPTIAPSSTDLLYLLPKSVHLLFSFNRLVPLDGVKQSGFDEKVKKAFAFSAVILHATRRVIDHELRATRLRYHTIGLKVMEVGAGSGIVPADPLEHANLMPTARFRDHSWQR